MPIPITPAMADWETKDILAYLDAQGMGIVPPEVYEMLFGTNMQMYAFTVSRLEDVQMIADVWAALEATEQAGLPYADFALSVNSLLETAGWTPLDPWHMQTIYRTNMASCSAAVRDQYQQEVSDLLPWWHLAVTLDIRTTDLICRPLARPPVVLPARHTWWATHTPPLHFNCRDEKIALTLGQVESMGWTQTNSADLPEVEVDYAHGFGYARDYGDVSTMQRYLAQLLEGFI